MILRQGFLLLLLLKSTTSHPSQKRDSSSVSISKPSQNVINDGNPVSSEPVSLSPHTVSPSYCHLKEVIETSNNVHKFHNWRTVYSMIVGSPISASPEHENIKLGEAPPDTTHVEALTKTIKVLDDGSINSQANPNETSITKSIKSSIETVPAIAKRAMEFKIPKWNFKGWRGWNGLKGVSRRFGGATQGIQKAQNMQKFQGSQGIQPGQINRNNMPNKGIKINNGRRVGSRFRKGVRVGRVRAAGRKGSRVGQKNKAKAVKGNSPVALPAIISDKSVVSNAPVTVASGKKNLKRPIFESDDSQTEGYSRNRNSLSKDSFHNPPGFSDFSNFESETLSRTRNKGKKNRNPITPNFKAEDYYSTSDSGKSDSSSSSSNPKRAKSASGRHRRKAKSSVTNPRPPEIKSVNSENKVPPVIISSSSDEKPTFVDSDTKIHSIPASSPDGGKVQFMDQKNELPYGETGMSDSEGEAIGNHDRTSSPRIFRGPQTDDMDMHNFQMGGGGGGGGGDNYGKSSGHNIGEAIGNILPIAQTIGNVITGQGNMGHGMSGHGMSGHGMSGYGGGYDNMNDMGGYGGGGGMGGYGGGGGMGGYGGGGGMGGYGGGGSMGGYGGGGLGHSGGNFGANEHGGGYIGSDPLDTHDLLDETRGKSVEKSNPNNISKIKKDKNEPELATEKHHEEDEKDNHDQPTEKTTEKTTEKITEKASEKPVQNSNSKETHNKNSHNPSKNFQIDKKKKNDIIMTDNAKTHNSTVSRLDIQS